MRLAVALVQADTTRSQRYEISSDPHIHYDHSFGNRAHTLTIILRCLRIEACIDHPCCGGFALVAVLQQTRPSSKCILCDIPEFQAANHNISNHLGLTFLGYWAL